MGTNSESRELNFPYRLFPVSANMPYIIRKLFRFGFCMLIPIVTNQIVLIKQLCEVGKKVVFQE